MARIGGRNLWIAVPAGLLCAGIVGALVYLAVPMVPSVVAWTGDTLRDATTRAAEVTAEPSPAQIAASEDLDCRALYPDRLWSEMVWRGDVLLTQDYAPPVTATPGLVEAASPTVRVACAWRTESGESVVSTLAVVDPAAGEAAAQMLGANSFACAEGFGGLSCSRERGSVVESHVFSGGLWLSSVETRWHPEDYATRLAAHVWR
ncbi:hypothetical protein GCM10022200_15880 [Microbacterium awajiense]|uniref:Uncharacterized protein n=1 Tax=Microbacterium awajiense TaxID=415214 RepID=A0ABP7AIQ3_9MICO